MIKIFYQIFRLKLSDEPKMLKVEIFRRIIKKDKTRFKMKKKLFLSTIFILFRSSNRKCVSLFHNFRVKIYLKV